jgi:hypothetical protein
MSKAKRSKEEPGEGDTKMSRILEGVFIIGCSLVGFSMGTKDGNGFKEAIKCSVQLVALAQDNVASNTARLASHLASVPVEILGNLRVQ